MYYKIAIITHNPKKEMVIYKRVVFANSIEQAIKIIKSESFPFGLKSIDCIGYGKFNADEVYCPKMKTIGEIDGIEVVNNPYVSDIDLSQLDL